MSEQGSPGYNQPQWTPSTPAAPVSNVPTTDNSEDQTPETEQQGSKFNAAEEARKIAETKKAGVHPLEGDTLQKADEAEEKRQSDLEEERAEHIRQRGNVTR